MRQHIVAELPLATDSISTKSTTAAKRSVPTDAPMLNYIFDTHSTLNKHQHHHDHKWGPHFEGESSNITVQAGASVTFDCRISLLQDKTVSAITLGHPPCPLSVSPPYPVQARAF